MNLYIGETIKRLRRERGITQETLAEYMNERLHTRCSSSAERCRT